MNKLPLLISLATLASCSTAQDADHLSFPTAQGRRVAQAVVENDTTALSRLLRDVEVRSLGTNRRGNSVLLVAADADAVGAARLLLAAGADPNFVSPSTETPLKAAVRPKGSAAEWGERVEMTRLLLDFGADPNLGTYADPTALGVSEKTFAETPLSISSRWSRRLTELLLGAGADPNRYANGLTPLGGVLIRADLEMFETLLCGGNGSLDAPLTIRPSGEVLYVDWFVTRLQDQLTDGQKGAAGSPTVVSQIADFVERYRQGPTAACH